jgi:hypothetical protein
VTIEQKVESAIVTFLKTQTFTDIPAAQIYRGIEHDAAESSENYTQTRILPCIVVSCPASTASDPTSGNRMVVPEISVQSQADDSTNAAHLTRCAQVFAVVATTTFAASISAALADFYCFFAVPADGGSRIEERSWASFVTMRMMVCGADIS